MSDFKDDQELSREAAERAATAARIQERSALADLQMLQAMRNGDLDNPTVAGEPVERERIPVIPSSLVFRKEDADLDDELDRYTSEDDVRRHVEDFNERVLEARAALPEGTQMVTMPRDVEATVEGWRERYATYGSVTRTEPAAPAPKRHWWNRLS